MNNPTKKLEINTCLVAFEVNANDIKKTLLSDDWSSGDPSKILKLATIIRCDAECMAHIAEELAKEAENMKLHNQVLVRQGDSYCWKLESAIQEGEVRAKPCEISVGTEDSAAIIADLEGYARRKFSVPEEMTVENNHDYRHLLQSLAKGVFYDFGEAFRDAVEDIVNEIQEMRAAL